MANRGCKVRRRSSWAAFVVSAPLLFASCSNTTEAAPPAAIRSITLLTGPVSGAYSPLGQALAEAYNRALPDLRVVPTASDGPQGASMNATAVEAGEAELGFSRADLAYQVYRQPASSDGPHLRSVGVIYTNALHLVVRRASGITRGEQMRGHRLQMAEDRGSNGGALARYVIEAYGLTEKDVVAVSSNPRNAIQRMRADELDVRIFASAYPLAGIDDVGPNSPIALLPLEPAVVARLRSRSPFFKPATIPAGTYKGQTEDLTTVGIDGLLLTRDTVPEAVVYSLTKALFDAVPELARTQKAARMIDATNAPATPVPLHPGAARYYRERDLFR
jgi:TRAP transporter TAXI family solute receptor